VKVTWIEKILIVVLFIASAYGMWRLFA